MLIHNERLPDKVAYLFRARLAPACELNLDPKRYVGRGEDVRTPPPHQSAESTAGS